MWPKPPCRWPWPSVTSTATDYPISFPPILWVTCASISTAGAKSRRNSPPEKSPPHGSPRAKAIPRGVLPGSAEATKSAVGTRSGPKGALASGCPSPTSPGRANWTSWPVIISATFSSSATAGQPRRRGSRSHNRWPKRWFRPGKTPPAAGATSSLRSCTTGIVTGNPTSWSAKAPTRPTTSTSFSTKAPRRHPFSARKSRCPLPLGKGGNNSRPPWLISTGTHSPTSWSPIVADASRPTSAPAVGNGAMPSNLPASSPKTAD